MDHKLKSDLEVSGSNVFKAKAPSINLLVQWICDAWNRLTTTAIISGFTKPGFIQTILSDALEMLDYSLVDNFSPVNSLNLNI